MNAFSRRILDELRDGTVLAPERLGQIETALAPGLPTARDENWKYANLRALERARFNPATDIAPEALLAASAALPAALPGFDRVVFVDGLHAAALGSSPPPRGVAILPSGTAGAGRTLIEAEVAPPAPSLMPTPTTLGAADLRFAAINRALAREELSVSVGSDETRDIEVIFIATAPSTRHASHPALSLTVGAGARVAVVERHVSASAEPSFSNARISIEAGAGSRVDHIRLQQLAVRAQHVESLELVLHDGADYRLVAIATGAAAARSSAVVRHAGRDSRLRWNAVALTGGTQVNDSFVRVDHAAPGARTEQSFRGIAAGRSRVAFNGHMIVHGTAPGARSDQSMKCLTAGPEAEADLRPQLEIYTDEVKASHGATVGKLDDTMRFYLLSRGLEPATADALLKWAFIEEVVASVSPAALRAEVERGIAVALGDSIIGELVA